MNDNSLIYAGIGSRETPESICKKMSQIAHQLWLLNYTLYSGGAQGADQAFEAGSHGRNRIWRPKDVTDEAIDLAKKFHPNWNALKPAGKLLIARNGFQVLGPNLVSPVKFIVCWTKDGGPSGGTGQAIRIAQNYGIKVYNLYYPETKIEELGI